MKSASEKGASKDTPVKDPSAGQSRSEAEGKKSLLLPLVEAREAGDEVPKGTGGNENRHYVQVIRTPEELKHFCKAHKDSLTKDQVEAIRALQQPGTLGTYTNTNGTYKGNKVMVFTLEGPDSANLKPVRVIEGTTLNKGYEIGSLQGGLTLILQKNGKPLPTESNVFEFDIMTPSGQITPDGAKRIFKHIEKHNYGALGA